MSSLFALSKTSKGKTDIRDLEKTQFCLLGEPGYEKDIVWLMGQPPFWCVTLDELLHFLSSHFLLCNMGIIKCYIPRLGREKWVLSKCQLRKQVCGSWVSWPNLRAGKWHSPTGAKTDWRNGQEGIDLMIYARSHRSLCNPWCPLEGWLRNMRLLAGHRAGEWHR